MWLTKAQTVNNPGWGQAFGYDGFGNLISETVTKNTAPVFNLTVDGATNHILNSGYSYDAAGNMTNNGFYTYNPESKTTGINGTPISYGADGRRLLSGDMSVNVLTTIYFRDPWGRLRQTATYYVDTLHAEQFNITNRYDWVMGTPMTRGSNDRPVRDRLGNSRMILTRNPSTGFSTVTARNSIQPYSDLGVSTGRWVFGTYEQGSSADYADQRWYKNDVGRFTTADPYEGSGGPSDAGSWNRYAYVAGDPVDLIDPMGLFDLPGDGSIGEFANCANAPWNGPWTWSCNSEPSYWESRNPPKDPGPVAGGAVVTKLDPSDDCNGTGAKMGALVNSVRASGTDDFKGLSQLYNQLKWMNGVNLIGHVTKFRNLQRNLSKLLKGWEDGNCGDPPPGVEHWSTMPLPDAAVDRLKNLGVDTVGSVGTGYLFYRLIRLLPSLVPILWETLPANILIP